VKLQSALLADAATVRDGLLHMLGGCITQVGRESFPAPLGITVAFVLRIDRSEPEDTNLMVEIEFPDGSVQPLIGGVLPAVPEWDDRSPPAHVPIAIPLQGLAIPEPGRYRIVFKLNDEEVTDLPFVALQGPVPGVRPTTGVNLTERPAPQPKRKRQKVARA
jgi:hypothetical protein